MLKTKYIVYKNDLGIKDIIIFSSFETHSDVATKMGFVPVSAGFVNIHTSKDEDLIIVNCYGKSVSLDLSANKDDSGLACRMLGITL